MMQHSGKYVGIVFVVFLATWGLVLSGAPRPASAQQPITISILDNGGDLALNKGLMFPIYSIPGINAEAF